MSKHTHGPWQVGPAFDNYGETEISIEHMTPAGNLIVAVALGGLQGQDANARLIAAAPDLLKALRDALHLIETISPLEGDTVRRSRAAIAKATGGQS